MNDTNRIFKPKDSILVTQLDDGESVLLDVNTRQYYTLNDTGARIWQLMVEGENEAAIVQALGEEWAIDSDKCANLVTEFLSAREKEGLITQIS